MSRFLSLTLTFSFFFYRLMPSHQKLFFIYIYFKVYFFLYYIELYNYLGTISYFPASFNTNNIYCHYYYNYQN